jgi:hypothetical protein
MKKFTLLLLMSICFVFQANAINLPANATSNNGSGGIFLQLTTNTNAVTVTSFNTMYSSAAGTSVSVQVYSRSGAYAGFTASNAGWTLLGTVTTNSAGTTTVAPLNVASLNINLAASTTTSFYLHATTVGGGIRYFGTGTVSMTNFSDANLALFTDVARTGNVAFGGTSFTPRAFTGSIDYNLSVVVPTCPTLTATAPAVTVVNSACGANCSVTTGTITAPTGTCPTGSTLQYSTNGGGSWSTTLPTYNQTGPAQTVMTRCNCNVDTNMSSPSSSVTTAPSGCPLPSAPSITITNNVCPSTTGSIFASGCGAGTVLEYATSSNGPWTTTAPAYTNVAFTVFARCRNTTSGCVSTTSSANTAPTFCPLCPDLSAAAPPAQVINSYCNANCTLVAGIIGQANKCPTGTTVQYSTNGGSTWSTTVPTYSQAGAQTILTRCNCNIDTALSSPTSSVTTAPADCTTSAAPVITITNNVCPSSSGVISASGCGPGFVVEYSRSATGRWSTTPPTYTNTAFTVYARCRNTTTNCVSSTVSANTAPTICPQFNGGGFESSLTFNVYPNPTYGEVNLDLKEYIGKNVQIELYSLEGTLIELIREEEILQNTKTINMESYTAGMYFVKLKSAGLPDVTKRVMLTK